MIHPCRNVRVVVFFGAIGWMCVGSAIGENADADATQRPQASADVAATDVVAAADATHDDGDDDSPVNVDSLGKIDLAIDDQEIQRVLQMLSIQSQRNILSSANVSGNISAALYQVDFYEALDAILHTNGFGYIEEGNFIKVYTAEEMAQIQKKNRRVETRVVRVNYLTATQAAGFVKEMLSGDGNIAVSPEVAPGYAPTISDAGAENWAHVNTMVITDYPDVLEEVLDVIESLDKRPMQIQIEATILEARLSEDNALGVDLAILVDFDTGIFSSPLDVVDEIINPGGSGDDGGGSTASSFKNDHGTGGIIQTTPGGTQGRGGFKFGLLTDHVAAFVRALDEVTDTTVLAKPKILTLNRMAADLISGEKLGYISTSQTETSTTQTVEFLEVGTQLTVRPFATDDGYIRMEIRPKISDGDVVFSDGLVVPNETTNELTANVIVPNGRTIVLGGLFKEDTSISRRQVPLIGDVPLLGAAFRGQDDVIVRSEVIFLIRPTVVKSKALIDAGQRTSDGVEFIRIGAREGLLPWSRSRMTAAHMRDALAHLENGEKKKALLYANMALSLDPTTSEAMRIKAELNGERALWPDSGILIDAIDRMVEQQLKIDEVEQSRLQPAQPGQESIQPTANAAAIDVH